MTNTRIPFPRILVAAPTVTGRTKNGLQLGHALSRLGAEVRFFDYDRKPLSIGWTPRPLRPVDWQKQHYEWVNEKLLNFVSKWRPNLFLCVKGVQLYPDTIRRISELGVVTAGYWIDDPLDHERSMQNAPAYDVYFTNDRGSVDHYHRKGLTRTYYLPSAVDLEMFRPLKQKNLYDLSFIGTLSERRETILKPLCSRGLHVFGPGWRKNSVLPSKCTHTEVFGSGTNRIFNQSQINLNIHNWFGVGTAMNLRLFEVPAAGGFLLTDWVAEIDDWFEDGRDLVCWRDPSELPELINYYLANSKERQRIAHRGYTRVVAEHSYLQRARTLLQHLS